MEGEFKGVKWRSLVSDAEVKQEFAQAQPKTAKQKRLAMYAKKATQQGTSSNVNRLFKTSK